MGKYIPDVNWNQFLIHDCSELGWSAQKYCYDANAFAIIIWMIIIFLTMGIITRIIIKIVDAKHDAKRGLHDE